MDIERFNHFQELSQLIAALKALQPGAVAVVAGHSYSIGDILAGLGIASPPQVSGHDQLFEVLLPVSTESSPTLLHLTCRM